MIERITELPDNLPNTVAVARVKALYNTYMKSIGVDMFYQTENGALVAFFGGMDGSFSLEILGDADFKELNSYFSFSGATVFCEATVAESFKCCDVKKAALYELKNSETVEFKSLRTVGIKEVYDILKMGSDGDIALSDFDYWYTDFCLRFNHNAATYCADETAAAVCGFMTNEASLITGVSVIPIDRAKGRGSFCLHSLIADIRLRYPNSCIFATADSAAVFYEKNGFEKVGNIAVCKF